MQRPVIASRERAALVILMLAGAIAFGLLPFLSGLLGAAVLYVVFARPYRWLARRMHAGAAAALVLVLAVVAVVLPLVWVAGVLIDQGPAALHGVETSVVIARVSAMSVGSIQLGAELAKASSTIIGWMTSQLFAIVGGATAVALNFVVAFFGLYYLLRSPEPVWARVRTFVPFSPATVDALFERFFNVTEAMLLGSALVAVAQGTIVGVAFAATGLPNPLFWGTATAFTSVLPVLGSTLVWIPGLVVLVAQSRYGAAVVLLALGLIASTVDNFIRPVVYRRVSDIHPMVALVGAFAGVRYFGLLGLLLGPLALGYLFELVRAYQTEYGMTKLSHPAAASPSFEGVGA